MAFEVNLIEAKVMNALMIRPDTKLDIRTELYRYRALSPSSNLSIVVELEPLPSLVIRIRDNVITTTSVRLRNALA